MTRASAGLLLYRRRKNLEVFLVHPGGPYWARRDTGAWSLPKGEIGEDEDALAAARRELVEETGCQVLGTFVSLGSVVQRAGKTVYAWAVEGDCDPQVTGSTFVLEWPPASGRMQVFPEVDRAAWFELPEARTRILPAQRPFIDRLVNLLNGDRER